MSVLEVKFDDSEFDRAAKFFEFESDFYGEEFEEDSMIEFDVDGIEDADATEMELTKELMANGFESFQFALN